MQQHRRHHLLKKQHAGSCIFRSRVFGQSPAMDRGFRRCTGMPHGLVTKQRRCCEAASSPVAGIRACGHIEGDLPRRTQKRELLRPLNAQRAEHRACYLLSEEFPEVPDGQEDEMQTSKRSRIGRRLNILNLGSAALTASRFLGRDPAVVAAHLAGLWHIIPRGRRLHRSTPPAQVPRGLFFLNIVLYISTRTPSRPTS